mmetsp:Transcript_22515/g.32427  ORF Transcript_22515/g.32427 Transcript_22515/m.32427 type:complete len:102 (-) Transcript_22515:801-1106(-)
MNERTRLVGRDKRVCTNCGKRVPEWSSEVHAVLCWRRAGRDFEEGSGTSIITCSFCERDFGVGDFDQHLYFVGCAGDLCFVEISKSIQTAHANMVRRENLI